MLRITNSLFISSQYHLTLCVSVNFFHSPHLYVIGHSNICYRTEFSHNFKHLLNHHLKATTSASKLRDCLSLNCVLKKYEQVNITIWKRDLFLSSHKKGGGTYLTRSVRLTNRQSLSTCCQKGIQCTKSKYFILLHFRIPDNE